MRDKKMKARTGGRRDDTCDHGLLSRSWKVEVCEKKRVGYFRHPFYFVVFCCLVFIFFPTFTTFSNLSLVVCWIAHS